MSKRFGDMAREARIRSGVSLRKVAEALEWTPSYVSDIERLKRKAPSSEKVQQWAELVGANPDEFMMAAIRDRKVIEFPIGEETDKGRYLAMLARSWEDLSEEQDEVLVEAMQKIFGGSKS